MPHVNEENIIGAKIKDIDWFRDRFGQMNANYIIAEKDGKEYRIKPVFEDDYNPMVVEEV
jgi:hypothetical protein